MEELKMLVEMASKLPQMALWVLIGFWAYKVVVVGSIYGVIRFGIDRLHSWLTKPKHELVEAKVVMGRILINNDVFDRLLGQVERLPSRQKGHGYVHNSDMDWLRDAISEKLERDGERK